MELTARELLTHLYQSAVDAVDGRYCVQRWLREHPACQPQHVIAIGKAAPAMLQGALDSRSNIASALVISHHGSLPRALRKDSRLRYISASHPVPDETSLNAGDELLRFIEDTSDEARILFLISGGASSMVEVLRDDIDLTQLQQLNRYLHASGKPIHIMNAWRQRISQIKGGGLLAAIGERDCTQLLISDVKGDDAAVIGSGLLVAGQLQTDDDATLAELCGTECSPAGEGSIDTHIIANLDAALQAARQEVAAHGVDCVLHETFIEGEAAEQGSRIAAFLKDAPAGVHLFGGETTVSLPEKPGLGGRNQTLALAMCDQIAGEDICVLCAGSDGIDGNTPCAGAVVTGDTAASVRRMGFDIDQQIDAANAGTVLMATGDLFQPGVTQTNVMDIIIAYKRS